MLCGAQSTFGSRELKTANGELRAANCASKTLNLGSSRGLQKQACARKAQKSANFNKFRFVASYLLRSLFLVCNSRESRSPKTKLSKSEINSESTFIELCLRPVQRVPVFAVFAVSAVLRFLSACDRASGARLLLPLLRFACRKKRAKSDNSKIAPENKPLLLSFESLFVVLFAAKQTKDANCAPNRKSCKIQTRFRLSIFKFAISHSNSNKALTSTNKSQQTAFKLKPDSIFKCWKLQMARIFSARVLCAARRKRALVCVCARL